MSLEFGVGVFGGKYLWFLLNPKGMSLGGGHEDEGKYVSLSWPSRFIGLRLKSVSFEDSLFEECYFEDVTSSNTFFRNCTFINTVFYNTGKAPCAWLSCRRAAFLVPPLSVRKLSSLGPWRKVVWGLFATTKNSKN